MSPSTLSTPSANTDVLNVRPTVIDASEKQDVLPDIKIEGMSDEVKLVLNLLLHQGELSVQTDYLHNLSQGAHQTVTSVQELNDLSTSLQVLASKDKNHKHRPEILLRSLEEAARKILPL